MSQQALPAGWAKVLDDVRQRLDTAVAAADARIEQAPVFEIQPRGEEHQQEFAQMCQHLNGLSERLQAAEKVIADVDVILHAEQTRLQELQVASRSLPQKLADWAARAIG